MLYSTIIALAALIAQALAAGKVDRRAFTTNGGFEAAQIAQPLFFFASGSCYPQDGEVNGRQTDGNGQDNCIIKNLSKGCQHQIPWSGNFNTKGPQVATYYSIDYCSGDNTWRVTYNLYFRHDQGHKSDWEWVSVIWKQDGGDQTWYTDSIILEQDGNHVHHAWADFGTFWDDNDKLESGTGQLRNHPRIYVDKWHHAMWPGPYGKSRSNCAVLPKFRFRMNDWYMFDLQNGNLASIDRIKPEWNYGKATNPHRTSSGICSQ